MSIWVSRNRMCLSACCPAQNITVQSEHHITFIPDITFWHVLGICAAQSDRKSVEAFANREQVSTSGESSAYHTHYFQHRRYRLLYIMYSRTKPCSPFMVAKWHSSWPFAKHPTQLLLLAKTNFTEYPIGINWRFL